MAVKGGLQLSGGWQGSRERPWAWLLGIAAYQPCSGKSVEAASSRQAAVSSAT
jgi:hypothetical protein